MARQPGPWMRGTAGAVVSAGNWNKTMRNLEEVTDSMDRRGILAGLTILDGGGLVATVQPGRALCGGILWTDGPIQVALPASETTFLYLKAGSDPSGATNSIESYRASTNLLTGGSFETDSNDDGLADGWTDNTGSGDALRSGDSVQGHFSQCVRYTAAAAAGTHRIEKTQAGVSTVAMVFSVWYRTDPLDGFTTLKIGVTKDNQTHYAVNSGARAADWTLAQVAVPAGAATSCVVFAELTHSNTGGTGRVWLDALVLEDGTTPTPHLEGARRGSERGEMRVCLGKVTTDANSITAIDMAPVLRPARLIGKGSGTFTGTTDSFALPGLEAGDTVLVMPTGAAAPVGVWTVDNVTTDQFDLVSSDTEIGCPFDAVAIR